MSNSLLCYVLINTGVDEVFCFTLTCETESALKKSNNPVHFHIFLLSSSKFMNAIRFGGRGGGRYFQRPYIRASI